MRALLVALGSMDSESGFTKTLREMGWDSLLHRAMSQLPEHVEIDTFLVEFWRPSYGGHLHRNGSTPPKGGFTWARWTPAMYSTLRQAMDLSGLRWGIHHGLCTSIDTGISRRYAATPEELRPHIDQAHRLRAAGFDVYVGDAPRWVGSQWADLDQRSELTTAMVETLAAGLEEVDFHEITLEGTAAGTRTRPHVGVRNHADLYELRDNQVAFLLNTNIIEHMVRDLTPWPDDFILPVHRLPVGRDTVNPLDLPYREVDDAVMETPRGEES